MFIDSYAVITQQDGDGGDSLHREGLYAFGKWIVYNGHLNAIYLSEPKERRDPQQILNRFEIQPGIYVRHPDPSRWYSSPYSTSRDQVIPVIATCAAYQDYARLARLLVATAKRGFFAQNLLHAGDDDEDAKLPDTMINTISLFIRSGGWWTAPLYPLLLATDAIETIVTLTNLIPLHWEESNRRIRLSDLRDVDDNNTIVSHLIAARFKPTPIAWLNRQIYALTRPVSYGTTKMGESNPVMAAMAWYHRSEAGGNPELAEVYRPIIEEYFSPIDESRHMAQQLAHWFNVDSQPLADRR